MTNYLLKFQVAIHDSSKLDPQLEVVEGWRVQYGVIKDEFAQLHEFVDLLYRSTLTMVWLLLSSSFKQISVMYSTNRTFFL